MTSVVAGTLLTLAAAVPARGQTVVPLKTGGGGSAHQRSTWQVDGATIAIEYGRPRLKGRSEAAMMPAGRPWRTGADAATVLTTDRALTFGTVTLKPGTYTINTQPGTPWQLLVGTLSVPGQWGIPYKPELEVARVPMSLARAGASVEELTFSIDPAKGGGSLRLEWGTVSASVPFTVGK